MTIKQTAKRVWQKPTIRAHQSGITNKFGTSNYCSAIETIDGVSISHLVERYGSPLFVYSEHRLRENERNLMRAFKTRYPNVIHGWSYKTNYLSAICNILHDEGAWAEVVSEFEYQKARALGVPGEFIIFNGPCKGKQILQQAVAEGARIHIDHLDELYLIESIAREQGKKVPVTIRLNFNTGYTEPWSRFGFNVETGQAMDVAKRIGQSDFLTLRGLHSHIGTFVLDPAAYSVQIQIMCNFMAAVEESTNAEIDYLDIGGGFASQNALQGIYLPPEQVVPTVDQYAEAICTTLIYALKDRDASKPVPQLVLESGRAVVDDAAMLVTSVIANKRLADGRKAVVVDAGVNILFTSFWYNHRVNPIRWIPGVPEEVVIYGAMCMNIDVLRASVSLPPLEVSDCLVFSHVGAYNNTQWMQFIGYRPNVVLIREDGSIDVIRLAEDLSVMMAQERIPEGLKDTFAKSN